MEIPTLTAWEAPLWLLAAAVGGYLTTVIALRLIAWATTRADNPIGKSIVRDLGAPLRLFVPVALVREAARYLPIPDQAWVPIFSHAVAIVLIVATGWVFVGAIGVVEELVGIRYDLNQTDNLKARRMHTKFLVFRRVIVIVVGVMTFAAVLLTFPAARSLGTGIFASAGIAGLAIGIAARPTLETLLAGVQLALTEPINIDDVVIVEGEWGRVEEIRTTYVVVRIWDLRRLIVPIQYFISQPFQNWTRVSADLLGAVTIEVDYRTPVDQVRAALGPMIEASKLWDRKFWNLQVVEAGPSTIRLRVLVTAADSSKAFDLRCEIREQLVTWLQQHHPGSLPRLRVETSEPPAATPV